MQLPGAACARQERVKGAEAEAPPTSVRALAKLAPLHVLMYSVPPSGRAPRSIVWRPSRVTPRGREEALLLQPGPAREAQVAGKGATGCRGAGSQFSVRRPVAELEGSV